MAEGGIGTEEQVTRPSGLKTAVKVGVALGVAVGAWWGVKKASQELLKRTESESVTVDVDGKAVNIFRFKAEPSNPETADPKKGFLLALGFPMRPGAKVSQDMAKNLADQFNTSAHIADARPEEIGDDAFELESEALAKYIELNGWNDVTVVAHSIGAPKMAAALISLQQRRPDIKIRLALLSPVGLYPQDMIELIKNNIVEQMIVEPDPKNINPKAFHHPVLNVLLDVFSSLAQDMKAAGLKYPKLLSQQMNAIKSICPYLTAFQSDVLMLIGDKDQVAQLAKIAPDEEVRAMLPPNFSQLNPSQQLIEMGKARNTVIARKHLPNASNLLALVVKRYGHHMGAGNDRIRQSTHVAGRMSEFLDRFGRKAA